MGGGLNSTFIFVLLLIGVALAFLASPIFILPTVLLALVLLALGPVSRWIAERGYPGTPERENVPTTREASYDAARQS
jgi:multisubunit Na+/H+ antiporter MnhG subunit